MVKEKLAADINQSNAIVGSALSQLCKIGILDYRLVDPAKHDLIILDPQGPAATWHEGRWTWGRPHQFEHKGFGNYKRNNWHVRRDLRPFRSKKEVKRANARSPIQPIRPEEWNGKVYFIIREAAFKRECALLGMPSNPRADWICPKCEAPRDYGELRCDNCKVNPPCDYRRPNLWYWPPDPIRSVLCKRCGMHLPPGEKTHNITECNAIVINGVMNS